MHELGLKTVYIGDYVENNPLGRAEWITVFGEFTGRRELARTLFDSISNEYNRAKALVSGVEKRPEVMLNAPWQDSWFVPGDRSYMVRLLEDAGGNYACRGVDSDQSRPISTETAFVAASQSDFWLSPGTATSLAELNAMNPVSDRFRPSATEMSTTTTPARHPRAAAISGSRVRLTRTVRSKT
ncbi:MAG: ABC transporter substrate-binding protein [Alistipes indistinctus]